ncbi:MAG: hypothetical protein H0X70_04030 [Segetibacter sp.]|jgi:hypothetical protein|nr:hypothetical protein [Segetibacter sp.]
MLTKEQVIESIKNMPEDKFEDIDILMERLIILEKIYIGIDQLDRGEGITLEELEKEMETWDD